MSVLTKKKKVARVDQAQGDARERHRERLRELTRASILDAARAVVLRDGVAGATLDSIAAELGLTKQGLYYHYRSKEALLMALSLQEWTTLADAVHDATLAAATAGDALEALVRTVMARYATQLELFRFATQALTTSEIAPKVGKGELEHVRPLNDRMYGPIEKKLRQAQRDGLADPALDPRRLAFVAHTSVMGLLAMKLMVESVGDPLRHSDEALVAELCRVLRAAVTPVLTAPPASSNARARKRRSY